MARRAAWYPMVAALALAAGLVVLGKSCRNGPHPNRNPQVETLDLLSHDWTRFAGSEVRPDGLHVHPLGRVIVRQDGAGGQPNPPVNLRGPHLDVSGDFQLTATMQDIGTEGAFLRLYGQVPIVYDEWRQERESVRLGLVGSKLEVGLWTNSSDTPAIERTVGSGLSGNVRVAISRVGQRLAIAANGRELLNVPDPGVFAEGQVWFGTDAAAGSRGWTLAALGARPLNGGRVEVVDPAPLDMRHQRAGALRNLAAALRRPLRIGAAMAANPLFADEGYRAVAASEFSMMTPENDMKPQFVHPQPSVYDFTEADALVDFAEANGIAVHGHTLVWHEALPPWMREVGGAAAVRRTMLEHVAAVAGHFRGRVVSWDVVNEPIADTDEDYLNGNQGLRPSLWYRAMGETYIDEAFRAARDADPSARLYLNDYGIGDDGRRWDALVALLRRLQERSVPIDGVGFQTHEYDVHRLISIESLRAHLRVLSAIGLLARISEMDVLVDGPSQHELQANEFAAKLAVCRDEPNCTGFGTWGIADRYGSTAITGLYPPAPGDALLYDTDLQAKPALRALQSELSR